LLRSKCARGLYSMRWTLAPLRVLPRLTWSDAAWPLLTL
jgi:hypothetical protein